ncbi:hypothetical protein K7432_010730 [Basidiobolus ranarum]|uniref:N-acetyltransferase domain-containing protein n=1 Tax=Basidiobolus ranarum TaxID=34480 RepID=A0ABR2WNA4_9FUNG
MNQMLGLNIPKTQRKLLRRKYFEGLARCSMKDGLVYQVGNHKAVSIWFPPGKSLQSFDPTLYYEYLEENGKARYERIQAKLRKHRERLHGNRPMWHCQLLGVDPKFQGHGYASKLVKNITASADQEGMQCYIECSKLSNVPIFEHYGFKTMEVVEVESGIPVYLMIRQPRNRS